MLISSIFVLVCLSLVMGHSPSPDECAVTKLLSGSCGSSATIQYETTLSAPSIINPHPTESVCFEVEDGECQNPVVEVLFLGDFNNDPEYFTLEYDEGPSVDCHGGDRCRAWASCPEAGEMVTETVWNVGELHKFQIVDFQTLLPFLCYGFPLFGPLPDVPDPGSQIAENSQMVLQVTVSCDVTACLMEAVNEEITGSTDTITAAIGTSQTQTIGALDECFCSSQILAAQQATFLRLDVLDDAHKALHAKLDILLSRDYSGSEEEASQVFGAKTMSNEEMEGNDTSKVVNVTLGTNFTLSLFVFVVALFVVAGICLVYSKYKN